MCQMEICAMGEIKQEGGIAKCVCVDVCIEVTHLYRIPR